MRRRAGVILAVAVLLLLGWWLIDEVLETDAPASTTAWPASVAAPALPAPQSSDAQSLQPAVAADQSPAPPVPSSARAPRQVIDGLLGLDEDQLHASGRVLDPRGRPIAGVRVLLVQDLWGVEGEYFEDKEDEAVTAADGRFRLMREDWVEVDALRVVVAAEGWPPWFGRLEPVAEHDVVLGDFHWLPLRLVFEDGEAVAGAEVQFENPGRDRRERSDEDVEPLVAVGRTDADGRLALPVFDSRRDLSVFVEHELHAGRHEAPLADWRKDPAHFLWTLKVPRGAVCELQLFGWPGGWTAGASWLQLRLTPYEGQGDALHLRERVDWDPDSQSLQAGIVDGRARIAHLDAPAYRVVLAQYGDDDVLADPWVPVPGLTTWTRATPPVPPEWRAPLDVDLVITGEDVRSAWSGLEWTMTATDAHERRGERRFARPGVESFGTDFDMPVTLQLTDLGPAGERTGVPPSGLYRFELAASAVLAATGGVRADLTAIQPPPDTADAQLVFWGKPGENGRIIEGLEGHGLPVGTVRLSIRVPGVDDRPQQVTIASGFTSVVHALPAPPPTDGLLRGRVRIRGDDGWMRITRVAFDGEPSYWGESGLDALGALSFAVRRPAGTCRGRVTIGHVTAPEARRQLADPGQLGLFIYDELPCSAPFECEIRAGQTTDIDVEVDASILCTLHVTAPALVEAQLAGQPVSERWNIRLFRAGAKEEQASSWVGGWSEAGVTLIAAPGPWKVVSTCQPEDASREAGPYEAEFVIPEGAVTLDVELHPAASPAPEAR
ncbi:MAG TPA: carboxypeptidase-like regulatory domain-containing protein [Planctomycetota bacterium]|nr:carboxypeptidase-like regulatory domain-containing protein [Planctomycetota bacterium]